MANQYFSKNGKIQTAYTIQEDQQALYAKLKYATTSFEMGTLLYSANITAQAKHILSLIAEGSPNREADFNKLGEMIDSFITLLSELRACLPLPITKEFTVNTSVHKEYQEIKENREIWDQCENISAMISSQNALINIYEHYTAFSHGMGEKYLLNEINMLSSIHRTYQTHLEAQFDRLMAVIHGGEQC